MGQITGPKRCGSDFTGIFFKLILPLISFYHLISWAFPVRLVSGEHYRTVFYLTTRPVLPSGTEVKLQMGRNFYNYIEIVCVTCPNILKIGIQRGAMRSLGKTLWTPLMVSQRWFRCHQYRPRSMLPYAITRPLWVNSLWPSDAIWRQRSESTLAQVLACCLTAPSHYLEPMLTYHQWGSKTFTWKKFHVRCPNHQWLKWTWKPLN